VIVLKNWMIKLSLEDMLNRYFFTILFLTSLCFSCRTIKLEGESEKIRVLSKKKLIDSIMENKSQIIWLKSKGNIVFSSDENKEEVDFNIRAKKDSIIWINFSKFKKKIARISLEGDSIKIAVEFPEKLCYKGTFEEIKNKFKLSISLKLVEDMIYGNPLLNYFKKPLNLDINENQYFLYLKNDNEIIFQSWIDPITFKTNKINIFSADESVEINVFFQKWYDNQNTLVPQEIKINFSANTKNYSILLENKNIKLDIPTKFPAINIDNKYQPFSF